MVTSTSTSGSMLMEVICFTTSEVLCRSINRLWIRIWNLSQVLEPSPQGVFLVVMRSVLVGIRMGPRTRRPLALDLSISSVHTFSSEGTLRELRVIRIL